MINIVLASLFNLRRYLAVPRRIFVLLDAGAGVGAAEYLRCLRPWSAAVTVLGAVEADASTVSELAGAPSWAMSIPSWSSHTTPAWRESSAMPARLQGGCAWTPPSPQRAVATWRSSRMCCTTASSWADAMRGRAA
ncbi:MAG: hypothetical protein AB7Q16_22305 [Vicinamibacterales bacterium]